MALTIEQEQKIIKKVNVLHLIEIVFFFLGFINVIVNMVIIKKFIWQFLALVLIAGMLVSAFIVSVKKRIKSNYKEAISHGLMQLMITLGFVLNTKLTLMVCSQIIKKAMFIRCAEFLMLFNCIFAGVLLLFSAAMLFITYIILLKIIRPVVIKKKMELMK